MDTGQVILGLAPALFGLIGTLVGAGLTFQSQRAERRFRQDDEARASLLKVSSAIDRLSWRNKVGARSPEDAIISGPGGIQDELLTSTKNARAALIGAGIPYRIASAALDPTDRLVVRMGQIQVLPKDPDDAQAVVEFLLGLLDGSRSYRRSDLAWKRLTAMEELRRGRRPIEGGYEDQNLGYSPTKIHAPIEASGDSVTPTG